MKIKTAAVLGAGAVGSYFIWGLRKKFGKNLWVVADGDRKERLESEGIFINGKHHKLHVRTPAEAHGADFLIVATKYDALRDALDDIEQVAADHTVVLCPLNGVDKESIIAERIGAEHMLYSTILIASRRVDHEIWFDPDRTRGLKYGEADGNMESERMKAAADLFEGSKIRTEACDNIRQEIWYKFAFNVSLNLPQAIIGCGVGANAVSPHVSNIRWKLRDEVCRVAAAEGVDISELDALEKLKCPSAYDARYSTLQDLDAGRHTEIDMFSGTVLRLAKEHGIDTPYNAFAYDAIKALEEKNDGKFDFPKGYWGDEG